jgi:transposase-like protein
MKYTDGFRGSVVRQVVAGKSAYHVAKETGVNVATIQNWLSKHKSGSLVLDGSEGEPKPGSRSPVEKLALLMQSKSLTEGERGEWLRQNGLHTQHLSLWEQELASMMNNKKTDVDAENAALKKQNKELQKELAIKEKALAEAAVMLTLKKNFRYLFQVEGDN